MSEREIWMDESAGGFRPPTDLHIDVPHPARIYDYLLGGKDNFPADREAGDKILAMGGEEARTAVQANRAFLQRAVRTLAEQGITQFLDIGTGIPTAGNTHEIAQSVHPDARVLYVDNDPIVLTHARALMAGPGHGATSVLCADLRDPAAILASPQVKELIDFTGPVALLLVAVLHFLSEHEQPHAIVAQLVDALPPGSHVVLTHVTDELLSDAEVAGVGRAYASASAGMHLRTREQVAGFFTGLDLLEPGLVLAPYWRPEVEPPADSRVSIFAGVGVKP